MDRSSFYYIVLLNFLIAGLSVSCEQSVSDHPQFQLRNSRGWKTLDYKIFSIRVPDNWRKIEYRGIESYVGGLTNGLDTLEFSIGFWPEKSIGTEDIVKHRFKVDTVNGLVAHLVIPIQEGKGTIGMSMNQFNGQKKYFKISGRNIPETETILVIFKSVLFPESNPAQNPYLDIRHFKSERIKTGEILFLLNCADCHSTSKEDYIVGPPIKNIRSKKSPEWIYQFLTDRKSRMIDKRKKGLGDCMEFDSLSKKDIEQILDYVDEENNISH